MKLNHHTTRGIALLTGSVLAVSALQPAPAHADKSKNLKTGAAILGAASALLILKGKTLPGVLAGAGAYYAYKKGKDAKHDENYARYPTDSTSNRYPDAQDSQYPVDNGRYGGYSNGSYSNGSYSGGYSNGGYSNGGNYDNGGYGTSSSYPTYGNSPSPSDDRQNCHHDDGGNSNQGGYGTYGNGGGYDNRGTYNNRGRGNRGTNDNQGGYGPYSNGGSYDNRGNGGSYGTYGRANTPGGYSNNEDRNNSYSYPTTTNSGNVYPDYGYKAFSRTTTKTPRQNGR